MTGALVRHCLLPALGAVALQRHWGRAYREWRALERSQWWPAKRLRELQWQRLQTLLEHAYRSVPYYRALFQSLGAKPGDFRGFDDYARIPPLTREILRQHQPALRAQGWDDRMLPEATGGSSGQPVTFEVDDREHPRRAAAAMRHNGWAGWRSGDRVASLWGAPRDLDVPDRGLRGRLNDLMVPIIVLDAYRVTPQAMARFAKQLRRWRPRVILGYASALHEFARFVKDARLTLPPPRGIVSTADMLRPGWRATIEDALGSRIYDRYGARECGVIASQCHPARDLHINAEHVLVEVVRDEAERGDVVVASNAAQHAGGRILITKLRSYGMSFLRYDIGDYGELVSGDCPCGRGLPLLRLVGARVTDFLIGGDGRLVSGAAISVALKDLPALGQFQVVQSRRDQIRMRIVGDPRREAVAAAQERLRGLLGEGIEISAEFVDRIERTPSGKFPFTRCEVGPPVDATEER